MRILIVKEARDMSALGNELFGNASRKDAAMESLQRLNPHVDFKRIEPGAVLLVPEDPSLTKSAATSPVSSESLDQFRKEVDAAIDATTTRVVQGYERLAAQQKEITTLMKRAAVKRQLQSNPDLRPHLDAIALVQKVDQENAKEASSALKALRGGALAEFEALTKLLDSSS